MLNEIKVSNFAIIDKVSIHFKAGFNVLSGETGSGKSVILKSLALLMGEKSEADFIKSGSDQAIVEGSFDLNLRPDVQTLLDKMGLESSDTVLVVRRTISRDGKNRVYINGSLATLTQLKELVSPLVEVTGRVDSEGAPLSPLIEMTAQHENRNLQSKAYHLDLLDRYLGLNKLRGEVTLAHQRMTEIKHSLAEAESNAREKNQRLDFLRFQKDEIDKLQLSPGAIVEIEQRINLRRNSEKLNSFFDSVESSLYSDEDSALVRLHRVLQMGSEFTRFNPALERWFENLGTARTTLEECVYDLRALSKSANSESVFSPEEDEKRLSEVRKVQKKYGTTEDTILSALQSITTEIDQLERSEVIIADFAKELSSLEEKILTKAESLHSKRAKGVKTLIDSVQSELKDLNMKGLSFGASMGKLDHVTPTGLTDLEFTTQVSEKDKPRPLAKFASGGELSRILLSLKRVVGQNEASRTYLFDEVDAGVSGVTAEKVGRKLKSISKKGQVICVTHLPQVAAFADSHFVIEKSVTKTGVQLQVNEVNKDDRIKEVARMISGEKVTKTSIDHAKELIQGAK